VLPVRAQVAQNGAESIDWCEETVKTTGLAWRSPVSLAVNAIGISSMLALVSLQEDRAWPHECLRFGQF
jgi:hypothetical protein